MAESNLSNISKSKVVDSISDVIHKIDKLCVHRERTSECKSFCQEVSVRPKELQVNNNLYDEIVYPSQRLGAITRKRNDIFKLMKNGEKNDENYTIIKSLLDEYRSKIANFKSCCKLEENKNVDPDELKEFITWQHGNIVKMECAMEDVYKYLRDQEDEILVPSDSASQVSKNSKSSKISDILSKRIMDCKLKNLTEINMIEKAALLKEQEIEAKLDYEKTILKLKMNADKIRMECEVDALQKLEEEYGIKSSVSSPKVHKNIADNENDSIPVTNFAKLLEIQNNLSLSMLKTQNLASLPKNEPEKFDGEDITKYKSFILSFERIIEQRCSDYEDKFYYLLNYTSGKANDLVRSCHSKNLGVGYVSARQLLHKQYGNDYLVASKYLSKLKDWPQIKSEDAVELEEFAMFLTSCFKMMEHMSSLNQLNSWQSLHDIIMKLPYDARKQFRKVAASKVSKGEDLNFETLVTFVNNQVDILKFPILGDICDKKSLKKSDFNLNVRPSNKFNNTFVTKEINSKNVSEITYNECLCCKKQNHTLDRCFFFLAKSLEDRENFVRKNNLCYGCLSTDKHRSKNCTERIKCKRCDKLHPTSLHKEYKEQLSVTTADGNVYNNPNNNMMTIETAMAIKSSSHKRCMCPAVPVVIYSSEGKPIYTYMGLDTFSTSNYIDKDLINKLKITGKKQCLTIKTMENKLSPMEVTTIENLLISSIDGEVIRTIPILHAKENWPFEKEDSPRESDVENLDGIKQLPFNFMEEKIGILLGMCMTEIMKPTEIVSTDKNGAYASKHLFGWAINGPTNCYSGRVDKCFKTTVIEESLYDLDNKINDYFCKDFNDTENSLEESIDEKKWHEKVSNGTKLIDGNFYINLPFKNETLNLPNNYNQVFNKFVKLCDRLSADSVFKTEYELFMSNMIDRGFAERVPIDELVAEEGKLWYLSHHGVRHKQKLKLRVVFDCSLKYKNMCLNDFLLKGPDLANSLIGVLLRFRQENVAISADIEKMFYMVKLPLKDRNFLRFFWLDKDGRPVQFRLTVHVFGAISSPSVANYALQQSVELDTNIDTNIKNAVQRNFYVDDLLLSQKSDHEAIIIAQKLQTTLSVCGFNLTAFTSNSRSVLESIPQLKRSKQLEEVNITHDNLPYERALGLKWNVQTDKIGFTVNISNQPYTKRGVLSSIFSIYDPLFIVSPTIVRAKKIFQQTCFLKLDWDELLPAGLQQQWKTWLEEIKLINKFEFPRCYKKHENYNDCKMELHLFSDGSELAYGSVCYLRIVDRNNGVNCSIVMAKVRLTPLDRASLKTVPRIELNAAKLSVLLYEQIRDKLDILIDDVFYWTDSMAVMNYLHSETGQFQRFVANRVAYITSHSEIRNWRHVPGNMNIADILSRGISVDKFVNCSQWINGPDFLYKSKDEWPGTNDEYRVKPDDVELKKKSFFCKLKIQGELPIEKILNSTSDFHKLKIRIAVFNKFLLYLSQKPFNKFISVDDLMKAENCIYRYIQNVYFEETYECLKNGKLLLKRNSLAKFRPFLDKTGVIRIGGRLNNCLESYDLKHPIILPSKSPVIHSLVRGIHQKLGHMGREWILSELKQKYHIIGANTLLKSMLNSCINCRKVSARPCEQLMADLPVERVTADLPPFSSCGTDYFGPFIVSSGRGRACFKRYGVIFTCLATRAAHLEVASTLDTDGFINAFRRFISRRGPPRIMRSDNGTNLRAGNKELKENIDNWNKSQIDSFCKSISIDWKFQPPNASHFGGIFEREIRTVRKILSSMLNEYSNQTKMTDEILCTLFCEIENILNHRPLTAITSDLNDTEPLTPNHLLRLNNGTEFPPGIFSNEDVYARKRWRKVQYLADMFWTRWRKEFLPLLQTRQKWLIEKRSLKEGDLVLVMDQLLPRNMWSVGKIVSTIADNFNNVRRANVLVNRSISNKNLSFKKTVLERPIHKLILLYPVEND